ncbi:unnamed protein product [Rotaria magnacalcarata]|uniref:TIR domain-containing protein n=3 Tax=Rotaria magnacalcarata TaxID=392030 RepID=A0A816PPB8_9BILA|nr:unnamed protein product [Rotaria magnacalcarata]CAF4102960.1 unnamed protein product [Rotaria magnacalcarata]
MESILDQLVAALYKAPLSTDVLGQIVFLLQQQTDQSVSSFVSSSLTSLLILERWAWELFSQESHGWIHEPSYQQLFRTLAIFNEKLIFNCGDIEIETKRSLLFSVTIEQINSIFMHIERSTNDNDPFIAFSSLWLDNYSYFLFDNPLYTSPIIDHIGHHIFNKYVLSKEYKIYLTQLRQSHLSHKIFTTKFLFYIATCSSFFSSFIICEINDLSYTTDEIIQYLSDDYLEIIHVHSYTVASWSKDLLGCITKLIGVIVGCCWWNSEEKTHMEIIFRTEKIAFDHVEDLMRIISHEPFYKQVKKDRSNDETILVGSILTLSMLIIRMKNMHLLSRLNATMRNTILSIIETAINDEVVLCGYGVLCEVLTDEELKDLKMADNICNYFLQMLEDAWNQIKKQYKQIPMVLLLKGLQTLSKNDSMQQKIAHSDRIYLLIEMCHEYPIVYDIIWALSFNQDIQQQLRSNSPFICKLTRLSRQPENEQMRKAIDGILWNLELNHENHPIDDKHNKKVFDIMISYSHKEKALCKQIYDELIKAGYRVWIDFDQMHGNVMDAMAQAIEQSNTVIICMSEQYRKSNYCRAEAQYAFQRERKIVPILLQKQYKPDGWLLFIIGQLLYVDFNKYEFPRAMQMLHKELKVESVVETHTAPVRPKENTVVAHSTAYISPPEILRSSIVSENILEWTQSRVQDWLLGHNLRQLSRLFTDCDGRSLMYLSKYINNCESQQVLKVLEADSLRRINESISLIELSCFHSLMHEHKKRLQSMYSSNT